MFRDKKIGRYWGVVGFREVLSARITYKLASLNSEQLELLKLMKGIKNESASQTHSVKWNWNGISFVDVPISDQTRKFFDFACAFRQLEWQKQNASIIQSEQRRENSRRKTLHESQVMLYKQAKAKKR